LLFSVFVQSIRPKFKRYIYTLNVLPLVLWTGSLRQFAAVVPWHFNCLPPTDIAQWLTHHSINIFSHHVICSFVNVGTYQLLCYCNLCISTCVCWNTDLGFIRDGWLLGVIMSPLMKCESGWLGFTLSVGPVERAVGWSLGRSVAVLSLEQSVGPLVSLSPVLLLERSVGHLVGR